jgi:glyoxylase-like metal-dependent hydrolase (beta-lactamase superfamily II)
MSCLFPDTLQVLERGWLSSNSILCFDGNTATLIDSGYVANAAETVVLVTRALGSRRLTRILTTHCHSDHIGGNAALQSATGCVVTIPDDSEAIIARWDEEALLLTPVGQRAERFTADATYGAGDQFEMAGLSWQALAVPGHDMAALALYNPERKLLISGDALWESGFGPIFPELLGTAAGLKATRDTLEMLARLPLKGVIPGHGAPFTTVDEAFERAFRRLTGFEQNIETHARHTLKVIFAFLMLDQRRLRSDELPEFLTKLSFVQQVNGRFLNLDLDHLAEWLVTELCRSGTLREEDGWLVAC